MKKTSFQNSAMDQSLLNIIKAELNELDREQIDINGNLLKPSQCYRFGLNPFHILYNTNCPDSLKEKITTILTRHISGDEDRAPQ